MNLVFLKLLCYQNGLESLFKNIATQVLGLPLKHVIFTMQVWAVAEKVTSSSFPGGADVAHPGTTQRTLTPDIVSHSSHLGRSLRQQRV